MLLLKMLKILLKMLLEECENHGFIYIDHPNVIAKHHCDTDGIHLETQGTRLFTRNILDALNG